MKKKRTQLLVDPRVQLPLIRRVVAYWLSMAATVEFLYLTRQIAIGPERSSSWEYFFNDNLWQAVIRLTIGSLLVLPLVIWDMLRLSNRFAGPVYRMRRILRKVADNGPVETIKLRQGDYWTDLAEELNAALALLESQRQPSTEETGQNSDQLVASS